MPTPLYDSRPGRWPQVSLRALFVLVAVLGIALGWVSLQVKWNRDRIAALVWLSGASKASFTWWSREDREIDHTPSSLRLLERLGLRVGPAIHDIQLKSELNSTDPYSIKKLQSLFPEAEIVSHGTANARDGE